MKVPNQSENIMRQSFYIAKSAAQNEASVISSNWIPPHRIVRVEKVGRVGRVVPAPVFTSLPDLTMETCCTHWNSATGGTGCASYEGPCPSNTFTVECGANGCW